MVDPHHGRGVRPGRLRGLQALGLSVRRKYAARTRLSGSARAQEVRGTSGHGSNDRQLKEVHAIAA